MLFDKLIEGKQCLFFISCSRNYDPDVFCELRAYVCWFKPLEMFANTIDQAWSGIGVIVFDTFNFRGDIITTWVLFHTLRYGGI